MALRKMELHNILVSRLRAPSDASEEMCNLIGEQTGGLVTERTFREEMARFRAEYLGEMNRHLRWLLTAGITLGGAMIALLTLIATRL